MIPGKATGDKNKDSYDGDDYRYRIPERKKTLLETFTHHHIDGTKRQPAEIAFLCWSGTGLLKKPQMRTLEDMKHPPVDRFKTSCVNTEFT